MLMSEYGSTDNLPLEIEGKILQIDEIDLNEKTRSKNKCLEHLPVGTKVKLVELELGD